MTACQTLEEKLPAYLEGALSEAEKKELEKHLETCAFCRTALQDLKKTAVLMAGLEEKEPPPWFTQKVMTRVREEAEGRKGLLRKLFYPFHIKIPIEAMASLIIAFLVWVVYQEAPPEMKVLPQSPGSVQLRPQELDLKNAEEKLPAAAPPAPSDRGADRQTPAREPAFSNRPLTSGALEVKPKEEKIVTLRQGEVPPANEKKAEQEEQPGAAGPAMPSLKEAEPAKAKTARAPAPAPAVKSAPKEMEEASQDAGGAKRQKLDLAKDQARVMGRASLALQPQVFTVRVKDVGQATDVIQALLKQRKAENILEETQAGRKSISAVVGAQEIEGIYRQLKELGEVRPIEVPAPSEGKPRWIRIEIGPIAP